MATGAVHGVPAKPVTKVHPCAPSGRVKSPATAIVLDGEPGPEVQIRKRLERGGSPGAPWRGHRLREQPGNRTGDLVGRQLCVGVKSRQEHALTTALATEFLGDPDMAVLVVRPGAVMVVASDQALLLGEGARPAEDETADQIHGERPATLGLRRTPHVERILVG